MRGLLHLLRKEQQLGVATKTTPRGFAITAAGISAQGSHCDVNEDCFRVDERRGMFIITDGLAAHCGGNRASRLAAAGLMREARSRLRRRLSREQVAAVTQAFRDVNDSMLDVANLLPRYRGMRASAVMVIVACERIKSTLVSQSWLTFTRQWIAAYLLVLP